MNEKNEFEGLYESPCGYFDERLAHAEIYQFPSNQDSMEILETKNPANAQKKVFDFFLENGFRRNDVMIYRETCPDCQKCIPIRIRPEEFEFSKSQRHVLKMNSDIEIAICTDPKEFATDEKIELMKKYNQRHEPGKTESFEEVKEIVLRMNGLMNLDDKTLSKPFFEGTFNMDYRLNGKLIGTGILDMGKNSLSANYFYYDIDQSLMKRSLGTFSILKEILFSKEQELSFYYLGYWIEECNKMNYKAKFKPHELRINNLWKKNQ